MNNNKITKRKQRIKGFLYILLALLIVSIFWFLFDYYLSNVPYGYHKQEIFIDQVGLQGYDEYYKYYYTKKADEKFYSKYNKVTKENIEKIKLFQENFKKVMERWNKLDKYDFCDVEIEENDYYLLFTDDSEKPYELYYYDTETHILYVLHTS